MAKVAILGASGVYARHLLPRLVERHAVRALVRRPEAAGVARACGAEVLTADIFDLDAMTAGLKDADFAINLATTLPGPSGRGDFEANDKLRREGAPVFIEACRAAGVTRVVQQSIAMVNAAGGDARCNEDTAYVFGEDSIASRAIAAAIAMEETVRASNLDFVILRGGLFYGPGTGFDDDWFARARAGKLRLPGDGQDFVSLVHIADMAAATVATLERWPSQQTLNICDNAPARWREVFGYIAQLVGADPPQAGGAAGFPSFRVDNSRARAALGWAPFYGDYRTGLTR